jgi:hypothetical protein
MVIAKCIEYVVSRRELTRPTVPCACTGNYGTGGLPLDALFGTLRDTLSGKDKLYDGACTSTHEAKYIAEAGANETAFKLKPASEPQPQRRYRLPKLGSLNPIPKPADALYLGGVLAIFATLLWALGCHNPSCTAFKSGRTCPSLHIGECDFRTWVPLLVSVGPVVWGALLNWVLGDNFSFLWPFHNDPIARTLAHLLLGALVCPAVVYQVLAMYFGSPYLLPAPVLASASG